MFCLFQDGHFLQHGPLINKEYVNKTYKLKATCSVQYMGNEIAHVTQWMKTVTSDKHGIMEENI